MSDRSKTGSGTRSTRSRGAESTRGALSASAAIALIAAALLTGCSSHGEAAGTSASLGPSPTVQSGANSNPEAKIHINYGSERDYLSSLTVTKYPAAYALDTARGGQDANASIFRFDGGVPVWQIQVDKSVLSDLPGLSKRGEYRLSEVQYGVVPKHFVQSTPDSGSPEPLEPNHYYIFSVMRVSGSTNYEAIKVEADGSLEGYDAEPRAGTSFRLCCNVNTDFPGTAPAPTPVPSDSNGPASNGPDSKRPIMLRPTKYLYTGNLSFSACLAENPGWLTTGGILGEKRS